jgi:MarR family transcriptional regulator, organic hydroperoxide resistance regulator
MGCGVATMTKKAKLNRATGLARPRRGRFSVRDYPFFFMHKIVFKNNLNIGEVLKPMRLTPAIWRLLALLQERDGITIGELSELSSIERTLLSRVLARLERKRLIAKRVDPADKRRTEIYLEAAGQDLFERILPIARRQIERAVEGLSRRDLAQLQSILRRITDNVNRPS